MTFDQLLWLVLKLLLHYSCSLEIFHVFYITSRVFILSLRWLGVYLCEVHLGAYHPRVNTKRCHNYRACYYGNYLRLKIRTGCHEFCTDKVSFVISSIPIYLKYGGDYMIYIIYIYMYVMLYMYNIYYYYFDNKIDHVGEVIYMSLLCKKKIFL